MIKVRPARLLSNILWMLIVLTACQGGTATLPPMSVPFDQPVTPTANLTPLPPIPAASTLMARSNPTAQPAPTLSVPAGVNLNGRLLLSDANLGIIQLDLATKQVTRIFRPPENAFVGTAVLSPDGQRFFLVYSRPRELQDPHYGAASLYLLPADGAGEPVPLLKVDDYNNYYYSPWWSSDSQSIYYGRLYQTFPGTPPTQPTGYFLDRYTFSSSSAQTLISNVLNVRISKDGRKLFYVSIDVDTTLSNIYVANPDGSNSRSLLPDGENWIIDSIAVSPDGESIVFSSADKSEFPSSLSWIDGLMGVEVAQAHNVPSDLFIMKVGEAPRQITHLADSGFAEDFSPDGHWIAFTCGSGTYIIRADGSEQIQISSVQSFGGFQWVP